jgi:hypothetical protein
MKKGTRFQVGLHTWEVVGSGKKFTTLENKTFKSCRMRTQTEEIEKRLETGSWKQLS